MTYSCSDFTDSVLDALKIEVPDGSHDSPSDQADLALAEIDRLRRCEALLKRYIALEDNGGSREIREAISQTARAAIGVI